MTTRNLAVFENIPQTVPHFCMESFKHYDKVDALRYRVRETWQNLSGKVVLEKIKHIALGLSELGLKSGDRVALISENRPEWSLTDLAILSLGVVNVPIYKTQAVEQIRYILEESGSKILFISGTKLLKYVENVIQSIEHLEKLIFFDSDSEDTPKNKKHALTLDDIEKRGKELNDIDSKNFDNYLSQLKSEDLATIIYTSGTTSRPKGVMLTHNNFTSNIISVSKKLPISPSDRSLSVLPLPHVFERLAFYVLCSNGVSINYCSSFDKLASHLSNVKPTIMTAVPRLFEQIYHKIVKKGNKTGGWKTSLFKWSLNVGQVYWDKKEKEKAVSLILAAKHALADKLVFSKWREGIGGKLRFFISGGAPLSRKLSYAFWAAGIPILQGYGMTEACIVSANRPENNKVGSVGIPFDGVEMKIAESDGEILIRGKNVMKGYYNKSQETAKVFDKDGWYHTGDVGRMDKDGHFYITDRKKDLFKISSGKYVAPQQLESLLKQSPAISQAVVVGVGRKRVGALIVPNWENLKEVLEEEGIDANGTLEDLCENPQVLKRFQADAFRFTKEASDYERVKRVYLLPQEFSIDKGEITPTLKIKRSVIEEKYSEVIDKICGG